MVKILISLAVLHEKGPEVCLEGYAKPHRMQCHEVALNTHCVRVLKEAHFEVLLG